MSLPILLFIVISISLLFLTLINLLSKDLITNDLLFFIFVWIILSIALLIFYFYFQDYYISFITSGMLLVNNFLLVRELKRISNHYDILSLPFFFITTYLFSYLLLVISTY